jgi:HD superfamily phosphohydrolase YqeK
MQIQAVTETKKAWSFVEYCIKEARTSAGESWWEELTHGGRHLRRVLQEAEKIIEAGKLDQQLAKCLRTAAALHDLGRLAVDLDYPGVDMKALKNALKVEDFNQVHHRKISAELFWQMPMEDLSKEEKEAIYGAIRDHSLGLVGRGVKRAESLEEKVLGLLVVADHADAASMEGVGRTTILSASKKQPLFSEKFSARELGEYLKKEQTMIPVAELERFIDESLVSWLVYNYQATWEIWGVVHHLLSEQYWQEEARPKQAMFGAVVKRLVEEQARQERLS